MTPGRCDIYTLSLRESTRQLFWNKVLKTDDCWLWQGILSESNHGRFDFRCDNKSLYAGTTHTTPAHRAAKLWEIGKSQLGIMACHTCSNRHCVRPSHVYWGTHADNMRDMVLTGGCNHGLTRGELHIRASVTNEMAEKIWKELIKTPKDLVGIAKLLNVSRTVVSSIKNKCSYRSVTDKLPDLPSQPKASHYPAINRCKKQKFTVEQAQQLCDMLDHGVGIEDASRHANTCPATLHNIYFCKYGKRPKLRGANPRTKKQLPKPRLCLN